MGGRRKSPGETRLALLAMEVPDSGNYRSLYDEPCTLSCSAHCHSWVEMIFTVLLQRLKLAPFGALSAYANECAAFRQFRTNA